VTGLHIGFVGAGRIGRPMVQRLVAAGHQVRVLGRSEQARASLAADGAVPVADLAEIGPGAQAVLVCVHTDGQVREICLDGGLIDSMAPGSVLISHTTGSPATNDALLERADEFGVGLVDAPISGGPHDVAAGTVTIFAGGAEDAVAVARPVLAAYADPVVHVGPPGSGQRMKLVNNAVFAANIGLIAQAVRVAGQFGLQESAVLAALQHGSARSMALGGIARAGSVDTFAKAAGEFLGKDLGVVRDTVARLGGDLGALAAAHEVLAELLDPADRALALSTADRHG
jgi:3-hydroxyisobutyrate dehydrogenase-like beta-hydroxyacid dehydrogenase